mgnify:CR=1 FL=1
MAPLARNRKLCEKTHNIFVAAWNDNWINQGLVRTLSDSLRQHKIVSIAPLANSAEIIVRFEGNGVIGTLCSQCCEKVVPDRYSIPTRERPSWPVKTKVAGLPKRQLLKAQKRSVKLRKIKKLARHNTFGFRCSASSVTSSTSFSA